MERRTAVSPKNIDLRGFLNPASQYRIFAQAPLRTTATVEIDADISQPSDREGLLPTNKWQAGHPTGDRSVPSYPRWVINVPLPQFGQELSQCKRHLRFRQM